MSAQHTRRRPVAVSGTRPILPKSTCSSDPGSPSATRTVVCLLERPTPRTCRASRCKVRTGTTTPRRSNSSWAFLTVSLSSTSQVFNWSWLALITAQAGPWPSGRCGRTRSQIWPISSSVIWASPAPATKPLTRAAST